MMYGARETHCNPKKSKAWKPRIQGLGLISQAKAWHLQGSVSSLTQRLNLQKAACDSVHIFSKMALSKTDLWTIIAF